ncbi:hypothetical protein J6590_098294, partial [Homalodisca vitripennis]
WSDVASVRRLCVTLGRNEAPNESTVLRLKNKFFETGSIVDLKSSGRCRSSQTEQSIVLVGDSVAVTLAKSIPFKKLDLKCSSLRRIPRYSS